MLDFHEKRKLRGLIYSRPVLIIITIIVLLFLYSVWGAFIKERETNIKKEQREMILVGLEDRKSVLEEEIGRLETDRGIEEEIREKFEVAQEGERVVVIVDAPQEENSIKPLPKKSILQKILSIF